MTVAALDEVGRKPALSSSTPRPPQSPGKPQQARSEAGISRRNFLKLIPVVGGALALSPFVPYGEFLRGGALTTTEEKQRILAPDGRFVHVDEMPVNSRVIFSYPRTGDPKLDFEPFRRFVLVRLPPPEGERRDVNAFRAYSQICVHLWCLWDYLPNLGTGNCPCHGSVYRMEDGLAVRGPAALQAPPANALPKLDLEIDSEGFLVVIPPVWSVEKNGVVGRGRYIK